MCTWFRDIVREAVYEGQHTKQVQLGLRNAPTPEIGSLWPPQLSRGLIIQLFLVIEKMQF
ncbi:Cytochrome oxidase subunit III and related proteins [Plasmopara halstedii]|uniref:Cytochrome oxidase subunit III and related proteins n=1 Tax=Plasmopara halstedii TaxID=4781 RepID=A0A0P1ASA6_PLAHL|nr:Cytochrome oxidase subunit III and related proteins [Plasmopara halstedii]CEG44229.1 Cytochrome oxidase subunit III and related proteins [Plasmopara halstedii]|eukprot:XP_024580598.1 Cytochrome oxidase subunit III and related proteins [Plasmopara halstedii]